METLQYSAGAVSKGFWFQELKKYIELLQKGNTGADIKKLQRKENILLAPSLAYGEKMIGEMNRRVKVLPKEIIELFPNLIVSDQKLVNLLSIMMTDRLFFEYMYEVYRENIILGRKNFEDMDTRVFFKNKSEQSQKVAQYTDQTKRRLAGAYKTYLKEANLILDRDNSLIYNRQVMDLRLERELKKQTLYPYFKALMGVV